MPNVHTEQHNTRVVIDWGEVSCSLSLADARTLCATLAAVLERCGAAIVPPECDALPPEVERVLRDPNVRLTGEVSALLRVQQWVNGKLREAGYDPAACVYKPEDVQPATTVSALDCRAYPMAGAVKR